MPPKRNKTKSGPAKTAEGKSVKKKEKRKVKTVIKFKLQSAKRLKKPDSQSKMIPPNTSIMPVKINETKKGKVSLANEENRESQTSLTVLNSKTMPAKITKSHKRKLDTNEHEVSSAECNTGSKNIDLALVKAKSMPARVTKATKRKLETETVKDNSESQSNTSALKDSIRPKRDRRPRRNRFNAKLNTENELTNGGIPDSLSMSPPKAKIMKANVTKPGKARKVDSSADGPDNMSPPKTTVVPVKMTKAEKRVYGDKERRFELANEVALAQLGMKPAFVEAPPPPVKVAKNRRTRRPRKQVPEEAVEYPTTTDASEVPIKTSPKKKVPKKLSSAEHSSIKINEKIKKDVTSKMKADSTSKKSTKELKKTGSETIVPQTPTKVKRKYITRKVKDLNDIPSSDPISPSILENKRIATTDTTMSQKTAGLVESRRMSLCSASDCFSWTKDISDSSTTTCVTVRSTDFVRIDNKIPIIKLLNCDNKLKSKPNDSDEDDDSDSTEETNKSTSESSSDFSVPHSLNLSTSSVSPVKSQATRRQENSSPNVKDDLSKVGYALNKILSQLNKIDIEVLNWIGPANETPDENYKQFEENIFKVLKTEKELIMYCRETKRMFSDVDTSNLDMNNEISTSKCPNEENMIKMNFLHPVCNADTDSPELEDGEIGSNDSENEMKSPKDNDELMLPSRAVENCKTGDNPQRVEQMTYETNDDDDALSLFAESITGIDPLRAETSPVRSTCRSQDDKEDVLIAAYHRQTIEAYVPQPVFRSPQQPSTPRITYLPTKILACSDQGAKTITVCEKQNTDSTFVHRETNINKEGVGIGNVDNGPATFHTPAINTIASIRPPVANNQERVLFMKHVVSPIKPIQNQIWKGVCLFNLISTCKNTSCRYPHVLIPVHSVQHRLTQLTEDLFIKEYMLLRSWPKLRQHYRMCFVEECEQRRLTRVFIEMAIDAIILENKEFIDDGKFKINVIERVLLYLNNEHVDDYGDLLRFNVQLKPLCHIFMEVIADTQNFSRFKSVFLQLVKFMERNFMSFTLNVANQILERLCILPFEAPLAHALMIVIKNTDEQILNEPMMQQLEKQLSTSHDDLCKELISYKMQVLANHPDLTAGSWTPQVPSDVLPVSLLQSADTAKCIPPVVQSERERYTSPVVQSERYTSPVMQSERYTSPVVQSEREYTSPDTTKMDNMNKSVSEQVVIRPTVLGALSHIQQSLTSNSSTSNGSGDYRPPVTKFRSWRPKMYNNVINVGMRYQRPMMRPPRPMMRPMMRPHRHKFP